MRIETEAFDKIDLVVDGKPYPVDVRKECGINEQGLSDEFVRHPSTYAWYASVLSLYESKVDRLKHQVEDVSAALDIALREKAVRDGTKLAEKQIDSLVKTDPKYRVLMEEYLDARGVAKRLGALVKALEVKRDCLIQIGARLRAEMGMGRFQA